MWKEFGYDRLCGPTIKIFPNHMIQLSLANITDISATKIFSKLAGSLLQNVITHVNTCSCDEVKSFLYKIRYRKKCDASNIAILRTI